MHLIDKMLQNLPVVLYQLQLSNDGKISFPYITDSALTFFEHSANEIVSDASKVYSKIHPHDVFPLMRIVKSSQETLNNIDVDLQIISEKKGTR